MSEMNDEQQILALHEAGDKALMSADLDALAQIFADDYVQYNESGKAFTKQDVLNNFRTGAIRYPSIVSTGRKIRIFGDTAVVQGAKNSSGVLVATSVIATAKGVTSAFGGGGGGFGGGGAGASPGGAQSGG